MILVLSPRRCTPELFYSTDGTDDCVVVSERGVIESGPNQCQTTLLITSVERFGINQTMALTVLVSFQKIVNVLRFFYNLSKKCLWACYH